MQLYASGFASVALGVARAMLDAFVALAKSKSQAWSADSLRDNHAVQHILGYTDAAWKAARAGLHKAMDDAWDQVSQTGVLTLDQRIQIRQAATFAIHAARDLSHQVFHEAGSTAIFNQHPFERQLRDVNSVSQQLQGRRTHFETIGLYMLSGQPNPRWL
jgi:alkylation response protein AidB-like acyl-CoA dehydrogenase